MAQAKSLMFQGTGSNVGKSVLVAGLCRAAKHRGLRVAPFKPQNMSNNAAVCPNGGEIGRAQALQARACGLDPDVRFNPVLIKPQSDRQAQIVVNGIVQGTHEAHAFFGSERLKLLPNILQSFNELRAEFDLVLVEGAGSPAETNLRNGDLANMGFAQAADIPVSLIADIERGGSIASLVGTRIVLDDSDNQRIKSFIINKFRGDPSLFDDGLIDIVNRTGWTSYGVIPWLPAVTRLPEEDAVPLEQRHSSDKNKTIKIVAPMLSRIANFDDLDPLRAEPGVEVEFVIPGKPIPMDCDVVILLGTKSALGDMHFVRQQGWDIDVAALARQGKTVMGICGGLQMLGHTLRDPIGMDGQPGTEKGLGLLDISTSMQETKTLRHTTGTHCATGLQCHGYEIHVGETTGVDTERPFVITEFGQDGAGNKSGNVYGTYLHGVFASDDFRAGWLGTLKAGYQSTLNYEQLVEDTLDELASELENHLDIDQLVRDAG
jgi:adenosylcobyric acid synthase